MSAEEEGDGKDSTKSSSAAAAAGATGTPPLPRPPEPENDKSIIPPIKSADAEDDEIDIDNLDIFTLKPLAALKLLSRCVNGLVEATGDVPPTPPPRSRCASPTRSGEGGTAPHSSSFNNEATTSGRKETFMSFGVSPPEQIDGVPFIKTPIGSPEAQGHDYLARREDIGARAQPSHIQHGLIARKFWSKRPPPITLEDYLLRLHKFCPMSVAVYLATNHYIWRLAVHDRLVPVTPRNVHRLVLAGLRVAMKALEDLSWPHGRFSKVGGVSENELSRLEITFCFLMDFSLRVDPVALQNEAQMLAGRLYGSLTGGITTKTDIAVVVADAAINSTKADGEISRPVSRSGEKRKASSTLPSRPAFHALVPPGASGSIELVGNR